MSSKRLDHIINYPLEKSYSHIYDLCCDHGHIGIGLSKKYPQSRVVMLDTLPHIQDRIEATTSYIPSNVEILKKDIFKNKYQNNSLLILSGIGGNLIVDFLKTLPEILSSRDLLICCNQHLNPLREYLFAQKFPLVNESIIKDNGRFYEIFFFSQTAIHLPFPRINQKFGPEHLVYLDEIITYLNIKSKHMPQKYQSVLDQYSCMKMKLICRK